MCNEACKRNDPSFAIPSTSGLPAKSEKTFFKGTKYPISVHKTDIAPTSLSINKGVSDLNKNCPKHSKPHPLKRCKAFRAMKLEERKAFLKEKGICFKCCGSTTHLAKDCPNAVKCLECDSTYHDSRPLQLHHTTAGRRKRAAPLKLLLTQTAPRSVAQETLAGHVLRFVL